MIHHASRRPHRVLPATALAAALLLSGCGGGSDGAAGADTSDAEAATPAGDEDVATDDGAVEEPGPTEDADVAPAGSGEYLDVLFADALHEGVATADAGTAYIEVAGTHLTFEDVACDHVEMEGGERYTVRAAGETELGPTELVMVREIGPDLGWSFEDEYVQLTLIGGTADRELNGIGMIQHGREEGDAPSWDMGEGTSPVVRIVDGQVTATGTMDTRGEDPLGGAFTAAAGC